MSNWKRKAERLAKRLFAALEDAPGSIRVVGCIRAAGCIRAVAPAGTVWASTMQHEVAATYDRGEKSAAWKSVFEGMMYGLTVCLELECDSCAPGGSL